MDADLRGLERSFYAGDKSVLADLERAYRRSGSDIQAINLVLNERLDELYRDDEGCRRWIVGASIYEIASAALTAIERIQMSPTSGFTCSWVEKEDRRHHDEDWHDRLHPHIFVITNGNAVCFGFSKTDDRHTPPDRIWPCLNPWIPPTPAGEKARDGRAKAFVKHPPKGVLSLPIDVVRRWADQKLDTTTWTTYRPSFRVTGHTEFGPQSTQEEAAMNRHFHARGVVSKARDLIVGVVGDINRMRKDCFQVWVAIACDIFLTREIGRCVAGVPNLAPLAQLLRADDWNFELDKAQPRIDVRDSKLIDHAAWQAVIREKLKITSQELPDWGQPKKKEFVPPAWRGSRKWHERDLWKAPVIPNAHRKNPKYRNR